MPRMPSVYSDTSEPTHSYSSARHLWKEIATIQISAMVDSLLSFAVLFGCFAVAETQGSCYWQGNRFAHGETFRAYLDYGCLYFICNNSQINISSEACRHNGICYPVGDTIDIDCKPFTCISGSWPLETYRPMWNLTTNRILIAACGHGGRCYLVGETIDIDCATFMCISGSWPLETYRTMWNLTTDQCNVFGTCYPVGATLDVNCATRTCTRGSRPDGTFTHRMRVTTNRCTGYNGTCYEIGATNVVYYNSQGILLPDCRCLASSNGTAYVNCPIIIYVK